MTTLKVSNKTVVKSLAGAIVNELKHSDQVEICAVGASAVNQMVKGVATARSFAITDGFDITCIPAFSTTEIDGEAKSCIVITVTKQ